ncbi:unnamed protein product [Didymodactylos carnosus]|uniref:Phosphatidylinositol N-acetylglucosaminyltransferase subunit C n=1 Tax=Didymodactylos carnosus TaxID=1234261 RepID=A0A813RQ63_9BILA|nr:unnamed protein product [Didymodactylos carnosus]CAF3569239.1 unnamed protein product [Didymodactylos carnosus]
MISASGRQKVLYSISETNDESTDDIYDYMHINNELINTCKHKYWPTVFDSGLITQQVSSVIFFVVIFIYLDNKTLEPGDVLYGNALLILLGLCFYRWLNLPFGVRLWKDNLKTLSAFILFGFMVSPVIATLTKTISTDTIYAMSTIMMLAHLIFYDYGCETAMVQKALSFSAALFSAVCLASRLATSLHTFTMVSCAVLIFTVGSELRKLVKAESLKTFIFLTIIHVILCIIFLSRLSFIHCFLYGISVLLLTFICPKWLISLQKYKTSMRGPWDEAEISLDK